jgi:hypothetical protein
MLIFALVAQGVFLLGAIVFSARWTIRATGFFEGIIEGGLLLYGLTFAWSFLFSVVIPSALILIGVNRHVVVDSFPEAIGSVPVVLIAWLPALMFAALVRGAYEIIRLVLRMARQRRKTC